MELIKKKTFTEALKFAATIYITAIANVCRYNLKKNVKFTKKYLPFKYILNI